jgi:hypothetical protein
MSGDSRNGGGITRHPAAHNGPPAEPPPEDVSGYLKYLRRVVPKLDAVIEQYVAEGLSAFERGTYFAAAVMIGAASEKAIYLLADSMRTVFKDAKQNAMLDSLVSRRGLKALFDFIQEAILRGLKHKIILMKSRRDHPLI